MIILEKKEDLRLFRMPDNGKPIKPNRILQNYFSEFALKDAKDDLWDLMKAAMGDRSGSQKEVTHFFFVYERLSDLLTASYLVAKKRHLKNRK